MWMTAVPAGLGKQFPCSLYLLSCIRWREDKNKHSKSMTNATTSPRLAIQPHHRSCEVNVAIHHLNQILVE